jgi:PadR family transcriptional regulator PadR
MIKDEKINKWESQVKKGMLEFIILIFLSKREFYGYELIKTIKDIAEINVTEGTIYPLLNRLKKDKLITSRWMEMETSIPRKYYQITDTGETILSGMKAAWEKFSRSIDQLTEGL